MFSVIKMSLRHDWDHVFQAFNSVDVGRKRCWTFMFKRRPLLHGIFSAARPGLHRQFAPVEIRAVKASSSEWFSSLHRYIITYAHFLFLSLCIMQLFTYFI